jgi:hypothetical protein
MANSASVRTNLQTLMQDHLSSKVVSLLVNIMPWMYFLLGREGNKTGFYSIGRPKSGTIVAGTQMTKARREEIANSGQYMPIIQTTLPSQSDGKVMGMTDTMPTRSNWTTNNPGNYFTRPFFKWVERCDPILVPKKQIRRTKNAAGNEQKASAAVGDLFRAETESVLSTHLQWWNQQFWDPTNTGPSNVNADVWDNVYSIASMCDTANNYGGVDRSLSVNSWYQGNRPTSHRPAVLEDLVNEFLYTFKSAAKGVGCQLMICGFDLFPIFKAEAKAKGGVITYNDLPEIGEFGFKREVVRFNNTYVVMDPQCPSKTRGDSKNVVAGINLDTMTVAINAEANFTVDEPSDLSKTDGGKDAIKSQIRTEMIVGCEAPSLNSWWEDVG